MTYGNNGYGPHNMDAVAAHETGHIFLALDQYYAARQPCTRTSGYLGVANGNSQYGNCASDEASLMRGQTAPYHQGALDDYARGQIGWRDSDDDGILDPVDTILSVVSMEYTVESGRPDVLTFSGTIRDAPYPSPSRRSTIINTISEVQYRVAGGQWTDADPDDGAFDAHTESINFTTAPLPTGDLDIELRVVDSAGSELIHLVETVSVVSPVDRILDTSLQWTGQQAADSEAAAMTCTGQGSSATSHIAAVYYRIDNGLWLLAEADDGDFDEAEEWFTISLDQESLDPGLHQVEAYSVDGQGNQDPSPAVESVLLVQHEQRVYLPFVIAR